jgi:hypothetical protein
VPWNPGSDPDNEIPQMRAAPQPATTSQGRRVTFPEVREHAAVPGFCLLVANAAMVFACGGSLPSVRLQPEAPTTVHVGETAAVEVPSDRHFQLGSAGDSLMLVKQMHQHDKTVYLFRAVQVGNHTLVATPRDPGPGWCISCVTVHYLVKVIQQDGTKNR